MQVFARIFAAILPIHLCFCQILECPTFCICYEWQSLNRIDCVGQGLLDVDIGLQVELNSKGRTFEKTDNYTQVLDLTHNSISILNNGAFRSEEFTHLEAVHLSHNSIAHVSPSAFKGLRNLKLLDLSHNRLRRDPGTALQGFSPHPVLLPAQIFIDAPNLRALRLGFNPLEKEDHHRKNGIEGSHLLVAPHLEFLDLGSCHLGHVDSEAFVGLESLSMLNLSDNQLITLDPSALDNMKNLKVLMLSSNPWPCEGSQEMETLEKWILRHGFHGLCPIKKFEKMQVLDPKIRGPQRAKDDDSLLYYYQLLGRLVKDEEFHKVYQHSDSNHLDDVEVFDEQAIKKYNKISNIVSNVSSSSYDSAKDYDLHCTVNGVPIVWFLVLAFQAGIFVSFIATFCWMAKPYRGMCSNCCSREMSRRINWNALLGNKQFCRGEQFSSNRASRTNLENEQDRHLLLGGSEPDHNIGVSTPVLPRAASTLRTDSPKPPSYEEHLALHSIRIGL